MPSFLAELISKSDQVTGKYNSPVFPLSGLNEVLTDYRIISNPKYVVNYYNSGFSYILEDEGFREESNIIEYAKAAFILKLSDSLLILNPSVFSSHDDYVKYYEDKNSDWKMSDWVTSLGLTKNNLSSDKEFGLKKLLAYSIIKHGSELTSNIDNSGSKNNELIRWSNSQYRLVIPSAVFDKAYKLYPSLPFPEEKVINDIKDVGPFLYGIDQQVKLSGSDVSQTLFIGKENSGVPLIYKEAKGFGAFPVLSSFECEEEKQPAKEKLIRSVYAPNFGAVCVSETETDNIYLNPDSTAKFTEQTKSNVGINYFFSDNTIFYKPNHLSDNVTIAQANVSNLVKKDNEEEHYLVRLEDAEKVSLPFSIEELEFTQKQNYKVQDYKLTDLKDDYICKYYQTGLTIRKYKNGTHLESIKYRVTDQTTLFNEVYQDNRVKLSEDYEYVPYLNLVARKYQYRIHYKTLYPLYLVDDSGKSIALGGGDVAFAGPEDIFLNSLEVDNSGVNIYDNYKSMSDSEKESYFVQRLYDIPSLEPPKDEAAGLIDKAANDFTVHFDLLSEVPNKAVSYPDNLSEAPENIAPYYAYEVPIVDEKAKVEVKINPPMPPLLFFHGLSGFNDKMRLLIQKGLGTKTDADGNILADNSDLIDSFLVEVSESPSFENFSIEMVPSNSPNLDLSMVANKAYFVRAKANGKFTKQSSDYSSIYKVQIVEDSGTITPSIEIYRPMLTKRTDQQSFREYLRIKPAFLQKAPNLINDVLDIGHLDKSVFGTEEANIDGDNPEGHAVKPKFKIRVTSSKTGRKLDLNILFVKKSTSNKKEGTVLIFDS